ncbi:MAG: hypothetical protein R3B99_12700 [Polyangiales bacterium]
MGYREAAPDETRRFSSALFVPWLGEPGVRRASSWKCAKGRTALVCRAGATTPTPRPEAP